jgi:hypothetical protein
MLYPPSPLTYYIPSRRTLRVGMRKSNAHVRRGPSRSTLFLSLNSGAKGSQGLLAPASRSCAGEKASGSGERIPGGALPDPRQFPFSFSVRGSL